MKPLESADMHRAYALYQSEVDILVPASAQDLPTLLEDMQRASNWPCFAPAAMAFCEALAKALLENTDSRDKPDIVALAFWLRTSQLQNMRDALHAIGNSRQGRGLIFQIAPGNVDTVFVYSLLLALLLGNKTVVKISSRMGNSAALIIQAINTLLAMPDYRELAARLLIVQYHAQDDVTRYLSELAQVRVIWGGDQTIATVQQIKLQQTPQDIVFPNRHSAALIDAAAINEDSVANLVEQFARDTFAYSQQACSSPRTIYWLGEREAITRAQALFWPRYQQLYLQQGEPLTDADCFSRELYRQRVAVELGLDAKLIGEHGLLRIITDRPVTPLLIEHCGLMVFFEIALSSAGAIAERLDDSFQTLTVFGLTNEALQSQWPDTVRNYIKRIVPVGQALSFSHHWDGINLLQQFSQECP